MKIKKYSIEEDIESNGYILILTIINSTFHFYTEYRLSKSLWSIICKRLYKNEKDVLANIDYKYKGCNTSNIYEEQQIFLFKHKNELDIITNIIDEYMLLDKFENS